MIERWGVAGSGILAIARSSGRMLLVLRSADVNEPLTWCLPGGKIDPGENARTAAVRELMEETGYDDDVIVSRKPLFVFEEPNFRFSNYAGIVDVEFVPDLNWENDDFGWFTLRQLPTPLHHGVETLIARARQKIEAAIKDATTGSA